MHLCFPGDKWGLRETRESGLQSCSCLEVRDENMLGLIALVVIVLWLLGFFAFHVTTGFIHVALVVGVVLLIFHLLRGRSALA